MPDIQFWDDKLMEEIQVIHTLIASRSDSILFGSEIEDINSARTIDKLFRDAYRTKRCLGSATNLFSPDDDSVTEWKDRLTFLGEELSTLEEDWKLIAPPISFDCKFNTSSSTLLTESDGSTVVSDQLQGTTGEPLSHTGTTKAKSKEVAPTESGLKKGRPPFKRSETLLDRKALNDTRSEAMLKRFLRAFASSRM
jgi:hypothetical protein